MVSPWLVFITYFMSIPCIFFPVWKCICFGSENFSFFFTYVHKLSIHMYAGMLTSMIECFYSAFWEIYFYVPAPSHGNTYFGYHISKSSYNSMSISIVFFQFSECNIFSLSENTLFFPDFKKKIPAVSLFVF